jgi:hypothetical protein
MAENMDNILDRDLTESEEQAIRESLETWREEVYNQLLEEVEQLKESKLEELEQSNVEFREKLNENYAEKMVKALNEMKEELRAEVLGEVYESNPELQILEKIKDIVAPTLNEEYLGNVYAQELQTLREENEALKQRMTLEEGAKTLAELISPYSEKTQNILLSLIKEGGPEEVTEQFYNLIENLESLEESDEEEDEDEDEEEEVAEDEEDDSEEESEDDEEDEEEESEDEETDESTEEEFETYIKEEAQGEDKNQTAANKKPSMKEHIARLAGTSK